MDPHTPEMTRRVLLSAIGVAALASTGCTSGGGIPETADPSTAGTAASDRVILGPVADIPVGGGVIYEIVDVVVTQPEPGTYQAFTAVCPHLGCLVGEVDAAGILCRCHGSRFALSSGDVVAGPSSTGLREVDVRVEDGLLILG